MRVYSFLALIHLDRFADLDTVIGNHDIVVEPQSVNYDSTVEVYFAGEAVVAMKLEGCIQRISDILTSPPVMECSG